MKSTCGHAHLKLDYWQEQHVGEILNQVAFVPLLKEVTESSAEPETPANAYLSCGLYALTINSLDYTKFLGTPASKSKPAELRALKKSLVTNTSIFGVTTSSSSSVFTAS